MAGSLTWNREGEERLGGVGVAGLYKDLVLPISGAFGVSAEGYVGGIGSARRRERRLGRRGAPVRHEPAPLPERGDRLERAHGEGRLHPRLHALLPPRGPLRHRRQLPPRVDPRAEPLVQLRLPDPARAPHGQDASQAPQRAAPEAAVGGAPATRAHGRDPGAAPDAPRLRALAHPPRELLQRRRRLELLQGDGEVPGRRRGGEEALPGEGRGPPAGALVRPRVPALRRGLRRRLRERGRTRAGPRGGGPGGRDPARRGAAAVRPAHRAVQEARHARRLLGEGPARVRPGPRRDSPGLDPSRREAALGVFDEITLLFERVARRPEEALRGGRAQGLDAARPRAPAGAAGLAGGHRRGRRAGPRASLHAGQRDLPHERLALPARARALSPRGARLPRPLDPRLRRAGRGQARPGGPRGHHEGLPGRRSRRGSGSTTTRGACPPSSSSRRSSSTRAARAGSTSASSRTPSGTT